MLTISRNIIQLAFLIIVLLFLIPNSHATAEIISETTEQITQEQPEIPPKDQEFSVPKRSSSFFQNKDSSEGFQLEPLDLTHLKDQGEKIGVELFLLTQAYSWPIFFVSLIIGFILLFIGGIFGIRIIKSTGGFIIFLAFSKIILINFAPEIYQSIMNGLENFFYGRG